MIQAQLTYTWYTLLALLRSLARLVTALLAALRRQPNHPAPNAWHDHLPF